MVIDIKIAYNMFYCTIVSNHTLCIVQAVSQSIRNVYFICRWDKSMKLCGTLLEFNVHLIIKILILIYDVFMNYLYISTGAVLFFFCLYIDLMAVRWKGT